MLTLLLLCSTAPASPLVRTAPAEVEVRPASQGWLPEGVSAWAGSYTCAQGPTDLSLTITRTGDRLVATFAFGPLPENPTVPSGAFLLHGSIDGDVVSLVPGDWLVRPAHYVAVGLVGELDERGLAGVVETPLRGCTTFAVQRER
jgi:hypothetical protein